MALNALIIAANFALNSLIFWQQRGCESRVRLLNLWNSARQQQTTYAQGTLK